MGRRFLLVIPAILMLEDIGWSSPSFPLQWPCLSWFEEFSRNAVIKKGWLKDGADPSLFHDHHPELVLSNQEMGCLPSVMLKESRSFPILLKIRIRPGMDPVWGIFFPFTISLKRRERRWMSFACRYWIGFMDCRKRGGGVALSFFHPNPSSGYEGVDCFFCEVC